MIILRDESFFLGRSCSSLGKFRPLAWRILLFCSEFDQSSSSFRELLSGPYKGDVPEEGIGSLLRRPDLNDRALRPTVSPADRLPVGEPSRFSLSVGRGSERIALIG